MSRKKLTTISGHSINDVTIGYRLKTVKYVRKCGKILCHNILGREICGEMRSTLCKFPTAAVS